MRQIIWCAPGTWHFKAQAQVWRKLLFNHTFIQLPLAEVSNQETKRSEAQRLKNAESRGKKRQSKKIAATALEVPVTYFAHSLSLTQIIQ